MIAETRSPLSVTARSFKEPLHKLCNIGTAVRFLSSFHGWRILALELLERFFLSHQEEDIRGMGMGMGITKIVLSLLPP